MPTYGDLKYEHSLFCILPPPPQKKMIKPPSLTLSPHHQQLSTNRPSLQIIREWLKNLYEVLHKAQTIQICFYGCINIYKDKIINKCNHAPKTVLRIKKIMNFGATWA